jgi:hypothetical protein
VYSIGFSARGTVSLITSSVEYILRILQSKNIAFSSYDLASDEEAKRLWRRKAPLSENYPSRMFKLIIRTTPCLPDKQQLPGILVGGTCPGVGSPNNR